MHMKNIKSLYVHIPFCAKKCLFCSFAVTVGQAHRTADYLNALQREAQNQPGQVLKTVYCGGGTPSFLSVGELERLVGFIRDQFIFFDGAEWTIEANPEGMDEAKAAVLKRLGFNRVSLGVQSLNEKYLKYLGRNHNKEKAVAAFGHLRQAGFENINVDLMSSFPGQSTEELAEDVNALAGLGAEHVSVYSLTIEENSRFFVKGVRLDEDQLQKEQYLLIVKLLEEAGYRQYEVSNFAKPGFESQHNMNYWDGGDYVGLGVGAHSHRAGVRSWNVSRFMDYLDRLDHGRSPREEEEHLSTEKRLIESILFGLRKNQGIDLGLLKDRFSAVLDPARENIVEDCVRKGLLIKEGTLLRTSLEGRLVLDEISARLI